MNMPCVIRLTRFPVHAPYILPVKVSGRAWVELRLLKSLRLRLSKVQVSLTVDHTSDCSVLIPITFIKLVMGLLIDQVA